MMNKSMIRHLACAAFAALLAGLAVAPIQAQTYPNRPVKIIVPYPPGNASDVAARTLGDELAKKLGQPVVVENRSGATGTIGAAAVAKSPPDGYTLLMTSTSFAISTALVASLPYNVATDFEPVVHVGGSGGMILVVNNSFPANNLAQFVDLVKKNPGKYSYAHIGRGTIQHLTMEVFLSMIGADVVAVPYKGSVQSITDIIGGQIPMMFDSPSSASSFIDGGKVKALTSSSEKRSSRLPNVPAVTESGVAALDNFRVGGWVGMLAPAKTPRAIVNRLNEELVKIMQIPEVKQRLYSQGLEVVPEHPPEKFGEFLKADMARWQAAATAAKIPKE
jgi:tripartite-type tricarboxylate transporter receptor subunit TctC